MSLVNVIEEQDKLLDDVQSQLNIAQQKKKQLPDLSFLTKKLKELEGKINIEKAKTTPKNAEKEALISRRAIVEYQIKELEANDAEVIDNSNFDVKIELLTSAISKLNEMRYSLGNKVLSRLTELMLSEIHAFGLKSISEIIISEKYDIQYKQDGDLISFDDIAEGEQLRAKLAFYLSLIQLDIEYNFGRHTRLLIIDSPGKEEADTNYLEGLSTVLKSIQERYGDQLQILIGTAERDLENIFENQDVTPTNTYVF